MEEYYFPKQLSEVTFPKVKLRDRLYWTQLPEISMDTCDRTSNVSVGVKSPSEEGAPLPYL